MALLECVRTLRARPRGSGRCPHASRCSAHTGPRCGRCRPCHQRHDRSGAGRTSGDRPCGRSAEPAACFERDSRRADGRPCLAGVRKIASARLCRLQPVRPGRREPDDPTRPCPRRGVAARTLQRAYRSGCGDQSVHLCLRTLARRCLARLEWHLWLGTWSVHGASRYSCHHHHAWTRAHAVKLFVKLLTRSEATWCWHNGPQQNQSSAITRPLGGLTLALTCCRKPQRGTSVGCRQSGAALCSARLATMMVAEGSHTSPPSLLHWCRDALCHQLVQELRGKIGPIGPANGIEFFVELHGLEI